MTRATLTSRDRVLWPATGFTKGDMLDYYEGVAPLLLPHLRGRPLTLGRFPAGVHGRGFATTECPPHPEWVRTTAVPLRSGELRNQCVIEDVDSLLWATNLGAIELHAFPSQPERLEEPAFVVLDLDPGPGTGLLDCARLALRVRDALAAAALRASVNSSGGSGLHVRVPLAPGQRFEDARAFAARLAAGLAADSRAEVTDSRRAAERSGRVLIDWMPNAPRALMIVPFSLRAADQPTVAAPLRWPEIEAAAHAGDASRLRLGPAEVLERGVDPSAAVPPQRLPPG